MLSLLYPSLPVSLCDVPLQGYAASNTLFLNDFIVAWTTVMNNDRFDGPTRNLCDTKKQTKPISTALSPTKKWVRAKTGPAAMKHGRKAQEQER